MTVPSRWRYCCFALYIETNTKSNKMKKQRNVFQMKEQDKTSEKQLNKIEISNLPDKMFKVMVINLLANLVEEWMSTE